MKHKPIFRERCPYLLKVRFRRRGLELTENYIEAIWYLFLKYKGFRKADLRSPATIEAIWYLLLKYKGFRKADLRSPATIRVQENEKS
ncbi:MAG: hypothetical protein MJK14_00285 [Rivularia sp. ALOHA_DT_140]|nr:hypothetical protein [Rivularia sp. ALOHA_DT_140]